MYVILRILKHMALVDFVTLSTYSLEQCAGGADNTPHISALDFQTYVAPSLDYT